jgi:hypothetical protein
MNGATKITTGSMVKNDMHQAKNHSSTNRMLKSVKWCVAIAVATAVVIAA